MPLAKNDSQHREFLNPSRDQEAVLMPLWNGVCHWPNHWRWSHQHPMDGHREIYWQRSCALNPSSDNQPPQVLDVRGQSGLLRNKGDTSFPDREWQLGDVL